MAQCTTLIVHSLECLYAWTKVILVYCKRNSMHNAQTYIQCTNSLCVHMCSRLTKVIQWHNAPHSLYTVWSVFILFLWTKVNANNHCTQFVHTDIVWTNYTPDKDIWCTMIKAYDIQSTMITSSLCHCGTYVQMHKYIVCTCVLFYLNESQCTMNLCIKSLCVQWEVNESNSFNILF